MSKKSRRRNRRLLKALGALGVGLALANRGRGTEMSNISVDSGRGGDSSSAEARKIANLPKVKENEFKEKVYQDAIMRGGVGVKAAKKPLRFGQVIDKKGEVKTLTPFKDSGLTFGPRKTDKTKTQRAVDLANKQMSEGRLPPQLRAPGRTDITTKQGKNRQFFRDIGNFIFPKANFKSGGRVGCGVAKKGFGKALKKGGRK
tara:strand:- start:169 stop:774 length:606 start_codon:yes stop_codon:yes gene_type:complete